METQPMHPTEMHPSELSKYRHKNKKGGVNIWMIISLILFMIIVAGISYLFGRGQSVFISQQTMQQVTPTKVISHKILPTNSVAPTSMTISNSNMGSVSGTLCYPASSIPAGTIYAKSLTTNKEFTQVYPGTANGGGTNYSMQLPPDTYHMKFTPQQYANIVGYYTEYTTCVGNPNAGDCSGQKTRNILPVKVTVGVTTEKINLCDYYYPPDSPPQY